MANTYRRDKRPTEWGYYNLDTDYNLPRFSIYRNDAARKVHLSFSGHVMTRKHRQKPIEDRSASRRTRRLGYYTMIMQDILSKYKDYEIHAAGHGNGALHLLELFRQGTLDPE